MGGSTNSQVVNQIGLRNDFHTRLASMKIFTTGHMRFLLIIFKNAVNSPTRAAFGRIIMTNHKRLHPFQQRGSNQSSPSVTIRPCHDHTNPTITKVFLFLAQPKVRYLAVACQHLMVSSAES